MNSLVLRLIGRGLSAVCIALHEGVHDLVVCSLDAKVLIRALGISSDIGHNFRQRHSLLSFIPRSLCVICRRLLELISGLLDTGLVLVIHYLVLSSKQRFLGALWLSLRWDLEWVLISEAVQVMCT